MLSRAFIPAPHCGQYERLREKNSPRGMRYMHRLVAFREHYLRLALGYVQQRDDRASARAHFAAAHDFYIHFQRGVLALGVRYRFKPHRHRVRLVGRRAQEQVVLPGERHHPAVSEFASGAVFVLELDVAVFVHRQDVHHPVRRGVKTVALLGVFRTEALYVAHQVHRGRALHRLRDVFQHYVLDIVRGDDLLAAQKGVGCRLRDQKYAKGKQGYNDYCNQKLRQCESASGFFAHRTRLHHPPLPVPLSSSVDGLVAVLSPTNMWYFLPVLLTV